MCAEVLNVAQCTTTKPFLQMCRVGLARAGLPLLRSTLFGMPAKRSITKACVFPRRQTKRDTSFEVDGGNSGIAEGVRLKDEVSYALACVCVSKRQETNNPRLIRS